MSDWAVETRDLTKTFPGGVVAVNALDVAIPRGCVFGLIGRNGAGKTTTLRLLLGLLRADRGEARVLGEDLGFASRAVRERVAYVSQALQLHAWMTLRELEHYVSHFYSRWDGGTADRLADRFELDDGLQIGLMSGGEQRKVAILLALAARPDVLLLDEPAAGLDPIARRQLLGELIESVSRGDGTTVLFSTHILSDLERVADHVGIMDRGRLVTASRLDAIQGETKRVQVIFEGAAPPPGFRVPGAIRSEAEGPVVTAVVRLANDAQLDEVRRIPGARVNVFPLNLEEIFIELFGPEESRELMEESSE
jgi:ABC-2 type transport system ATP-binding protein